MRGALTTCLVSICVAGVARGAETRWDLDPYRIEIVLAASDQPELTPQLRVELVNEIETQAHNYVGPPWRLEIITAEGRLRTRALAALDRLSIEDLPDGWQSFDKLIFMALDYQRGYLLRLREFDAVVEQWGPVVERQLAVRGDLGAAAFRLLLSVFSPICEIESIDGKLAALRWRAAALKPRDESLVFAPAGLVLAPLLRTSDRDGQTKRVQPIDWTYVVVAAEPADAAQGRIYTSVRGALGRKRAGRVQQLGLAIHPLPLPTRIALRSRGADERPLPGYDVYAFAPDSTESQLIGHTNSAGEVALAPQANPLVMVVVKHGTELLARLPVVPGQKPTLTVRVADDGPRLAAEGFVVGLQERLIDVVVRREVLLARLRLRIEEQKYDQAAKLMDELRRLDGQQQFLLALEQQEQKSVADDERVQRKIKKLFADTRKLVGEYLDPKEINRAEIELDRARRERPAEEVGMKTD